MRTAVTDRLAGALGTAAILSLIGMVLLLGLRVDRPALPSTTPALIVITAASVKPRPLAKPVRNQRRRERPSVPNVENKAASIAATAPATVLAITVAAKPDVAFAANSSAATQIGPGEGAGGRGEGSGGGGSGAEDGDTPPRQIKGKLDFADVPRALREAGVGGTVEVRYRVEIDGRADICHVDVSSGDENLDQLTCTLIQRRFRFLPARDGIGNPVRSTIVQRHIWTNETKRPLTNRPEIP